MFCNIVIVKKCACRMSAARHNGRITYEERKDEKDVCGLRKIGFGQDGDGEGNLPRNLRRVQNQGETLNKRLRAEILAKITFSNLTVGFSSMGDIPKTIYERTKLLIEQKCDIIVCAVRETRDGRQKAALETIAHEHGYALEYVHVERNERNGKANDERLAVKESAKTKIVSEIKRMVGKA